MALTASTVGPYFASGSISFSQLRANFKEASSGEVKASELLRVTDLTNTDPIVPDATENSSISTSSDLKTSQFRNSIKYYNLDQGSSDSDANLNIANSSLWNGNLGKTIVKTVTLAGESTSEIANTPAASLDAAAVYNVLLIITGQILGDGGAAGTLGVNGGDGGHAIYINTNGTGTVTVRTSGGAAQVYGGGGGGGYGGEGGDGGTGSQTFSGSHYWANTGCVGNNMPCQYSPNFNSPIPCDRERCNAIRACGDGINYTLWQKECWDDYNYTNYYSGGSGGTGGIGGLGQGYNQTRQLGIGGLSGSNGGTNAGRGGDGGTSGSGGDWGENGEDGNTGDDGTNGNHTNGTAGEAGTLGGAAGRAVAGSGYIIDTANGIDSAYKGAK
jgi:hypothetical protein